MIKWIKNTRKAPNSKTSNYKGIKKQKNGTYLARLVIIKNREKIYITIGTYKTEKEAVKARVEFILKLL